MLNQGDYAGYYKLACKGNDAYACEAGKIAEGRSLPAIATTWRLKFVASDLGIQALSIPLTVDGCFKQKLYIC